VIWKSKETDKSAVGERGYQGVAAMFSVNGLEFIVLAPSVAALQDVVRTYEFRDGNEVDLERCVEGVFSRLTKGVGNNGDL